MNELAGRGGWVFKERAAAVKRERPSCDARAYIHVGPVRWFEEHTLSQKLNTARLGTCTPRGSRFAKRRPFHRNETERNEISRNSRNEIEKTVTEALSHFLFTLGASAYLSAIASGQLSACQQMAAMGELPAAFSCEADAAELVEAGRGK